MSGTMFPVRPSDVAALTVKEFTSDLELSHAPSIDAVCRTFAHDANRALVWLIRFRALKAWCARADQTAWLSAGAGTYRDACEAAASFTLNDCWEFDAEDFCCAVEIVISRRLPTRLE
jgi:hypothetical protein